MLIGKYRLFRVIGEGSFSYVKLGYHIFTQEPVAVKIVAKSSMKDPNDLKWLNREVEVMRRLDHPGVVKMIDFIEDEEAYYMVLEYCGGGELFDFIINRTRVEEPLAKVFFKQIVETIGYVHSQGVVHRDLKPENLLLTETNQIKLIDFGLCSTVVDKPLTSKCGSAIYMSPEIINGKPYMGIPADIWALGVILYALVDGSLPWFYQDEKKMASQITTGTFPMPKSLSAECKSLLKAILNPNTKKRITIPEILSHPWLNGIGNVFKTAKPKKLVSKKEEKEKRIGLQFGGFSSADFRINPTPQVQEPPSPLETIYEAEPQPPINMNPKRNDRKARGGTAKEKKIAPRSVSLDETTMDENDDTKNEDGTSTHRGAIFSSTVSCKDPLTVALQFEETLISQKITYTHSEDLLFRLTSQDLTITAEVCRLYGFRNVYLISFKRIHGDSWAYTQFVTQILNTMKLPGK